MFLVESVENSAKTDLYVFDYNPQGKKIIKKITNFYPYFYVKESEPVPIDYRILKIEKGFTGILGESLKKVVVKKSSDIPVIRKKFSQHWEGDILFTQRYIIDKIGEARIYPLNIMSLDIECDDSKGFPDYTNPRSKIISMALCSDKGIKKCFIVKNPNWTEDTLATLTKNQYVKIFNTEKSMLSYLILYLKLTDPDVITGWNVIDFDMLYLLNRLRYLNIEFDGLSPLNKVILKNDKHDVKIKGRILFDLMTAYKHFRMVSNQGVAESLSLENVSNELLGVGKIKHSETFNELWSEMPNKLIEYNLRDAELVLRINKELDLINFYNYMRAICNAQLTQVFQSSALVDGFLLHKCHNKIVLPSKNRTKNHKKFAGAYVHLPKPGLYENVVSFDFAGMYPSLIKTFNISYETFNPLGEIKLKKGIGFIKHKKGLLPAVMEELGKERKKFKEKLRAAVTPKEKELYNYKQYVMKVLMNCFSHDTNVLTPTGIVNIKDLKIGDEVYSIHPENLQLQLKKVTKTYEYDYDGEMYNFKNRWLDLLVTPNHRMLVMTIDGDVHFREAKDVVKGLRIPIHKKSLIPLHESSKDNYIAELLGEPEIITTCDKEEDMVNTLKILIEHGYKVRWEYNINRFIIHGSKYATPFSSFKNIKKVSNNSDKVYCVEVEDNHTLLAGRNGTLNWTGQSVYGYLGFEGSRLYKNEIAEAVTTFGQLLIKESISYLKSIGYDTIYSDTDSVFFKVKNTNDFKILKEANNVLVKLNNHFNEYVKTFGAENNYIKMEFEKVIDKILFVTKKGQATGAKKRYAYTLKYPNNSDKIYLKGFHAKRSDTPKLSKDAQLELLRMIFNKEDKEMVLNYINMLVEKIKHHEIPIETLATPTGINKPLTEYGKETINNKTGTKYRTGTPPVIAASLYSNKYLGTNFGHGDKPKWLYVKSVPPGFPPTSVIAFKDECPSGFVPDYEKTIKKVLIDKLETLCISAGYGDIPDFSKNEILLQNFIGD